MQNLLLGYQNAVLTSTLTASSEAAGLGASNLQNDQGASSAAWQSTATGAYVVLDSGSAASAWRVFGVFRTNLTGAATARWRVSQNADLTSPAYDQSAAAGVLAGYGQSVRVAPAAVTGRYCRLDLSDPGNPDGFLNVPLLYAGPAFQPVRNFDYQSTPGRTGQNVKAATRAGGVTIRSDWTKRVFDLSFSAIKAADLPAFQMLDLYARQGNNVLLVPNPDAATLQQDALFGECEPSSGFTYPHQSADARGWRVTMTERL